MDHERVAQAPGHTSPSRDEAHTPLPWRVFTTPDGRVLVGIGSEDGGGVCDAGFGVWSWKDDEGIANALLIVRAVNCHAELVAALKLLLNHPMTQISEAVERPIRAALSKAEPR